MEPSKDVYVAIGDLESTMPDVRVFEHEEDCVQYCEEKTDIDEDIEYRMISTQLIGR